MKAQIKNTEGGDFYIINENQTQINYFGEWCDIEEDQDGDFYFTHNGLVTYFQISKENDNS